MENRNKKIETVINNDVLAVDYIKTVEDRKQRNKLAEKIKNEQRMEFVAMILLTVFFALMCFVFFLGMSDFVGMIEEFINV